MAGILCNSASKTMVSGDTAVDKAVSGYVTAEQCVLTTFPTGTNYLWGIALPSGSASARAALSSTTAAAPTFTPDVAGTYTITADVDGTAYVIRVAVVAAQIAEAVQGGLQFVQTTDASVTAPASTAVRIYFSSDQSALCVRTSAGLYTVDLTSV